jgi:uncharacterized membrane protein
LVTRRSYIDWARGLAVLIMIEAHVLDAWTLRSERDTLTFGYLNLLGGYAAPLFLWLAGLALVLSAERSLTRGATRSDAAATVVRRGLQIFLLAFLFRLQAFVASPGNPPVSLLRVDILNIMGPALALTGVLWGIARGPRSAAVLCGGVAVGLAMVTPLTRVATWLPALPAPLQWYVSPNGNHSTFTLFPWAGFAFAGAACGAVLAHADTSDEGRRLEGMAAAGFVIAAGCYVASMLPSIYPPSMSSFWHTSPTYFGLRVSILMVLLWTLFLLAPVAAAVPRAFGVLAYFGRHSLFVYWIHVELVYGYATMAIHHRLPLWGTAAAYVAFCCAMYWSIALKNRIAGWWRPSSSTSSSPQPVSA